MVEKESNINAKYMHKILKKFHKHRKKFCNNDMYFQKISLSFHLIKKNLVFFFVLLALPVCIL